MYTYSVESWATLYVCEHVLVSLFSFVQLGLLHQYLNMGGYLKL